MKPTILRCTALLLAAASASVFVSSASAQSLRGADVAAARPAIDTAAIARDLRARGVPDSDVEVSQARIRAWLAAGASPARIRAYLQGLNDRPDRPDAVRPEVTPAEVIRPNVDASEVTRPAATQVRPQVTPAQVVRPEVRARGVVVQRSDTTVRPINPRNVRSAVTRPRADN